MALRSDNLEKPLRKLRKLLKEVVDDSSPEMIHDLRTRSRRLETILHALALDQQSGGRKLLKTFTPIRKRAGKIRDMDVLTGFATTLSKNEDERCLVQLLQHLGTKRSRSEKKLRSIVQARNKTARTALKQFVNYLDKHLDAQKKGDTKASEWRHQAAAQALELSNEVAAWPKLKEENLHPFRLEIKQLAYVLDLAQETDGKFLEALGETKDAIGEWHDWCELEAVANKALNHGNNCPIRNEIHERAQEKLSNALALASRLRKEHLGDVPERRPGRKQQAIRLKPPAVMAAAGLAS